jgi:hypothetical protein
MHQNLAMQTLDSLDHFSAQVRLRKIRNQHQDLWIIDTLLEALYKPVSVQAEVRLVVFIINL